MDSGTFNLNVILIGYDDRTAKFSYDDDASRDKLRNVLGYAPYGEFFAYRGNNWEDRLSLDSLIGHHLVASVKIDIISKFSKRGKKKLVLCSLAMK